MNRSRWWALALLISATPRCSCEDGESLVRAAVEMELTFLEEEGCAPEPVRLRIPDDFKEGRAPAADFGSRDFRRFEVRSRGTTSLQVDAVELSQADDEFTLEITDGAGNPVSFPVALPPVSSESAPPGLIIVARYSATDTEPDGVELVVRSDDPDREEVRFALTAGRGRIEVCTETGCGDLAAVTFGAVPQGASASKTVSVRNIGEGDLDLRAIRLVSASTEFCAPAATEIPDFTPNCDLEAQCLVLRANETLDVDIRYAPTDGNVDTGELVIVSGDTQASSVTVPINAQGAEPALCVCAVENGDCTPTGAIDFGLAEVGSSVEKAVRFVSCGSEAVELTEAEIERRPGHPFETGPEFDALSTFSTGVLPPGQFSEATLRYAPTTPGQHEGGLRYRTASGADAWVALTGQSATCQLDAVPNRINFGTVAGGVASDRTVVLTNLGGRACTVTALSGLSGVFSIFDAPALPFTVDPGRTQNIGVRFSPPTGPIQDYMATLQIASDAVGAGAREVELVAIGGGEPQCTVEVAPS
ncbi:MAG: choice-of-anchor D domain-containing protein, partial [Myxococcota bacterium]